MMKTTLLKHDDFGRIRVGDIDGQTYIVLVDLINILHMEHPRDMVAKYCHEKTKDTLLSEAGRVSSKEMDLISVRDLRNLLSHFSSASVQEFADWILDELGVPADGYEEPEVLSTECIDIGDTRLPIVELDGVRVVSFADVDRVHHKGSGAARKRFGMHKDRFILGEDYFIVKAQDLQLGLMVTIGINPDTISPRGRIYLTESGYLMLVKTFTDDLSWDIQRKLVNTYFKTKDMVASNNTGVSTQLLISMMEQQTKAFNMMSQYIADTNKILIPLIERINQLEARADQPMIAQDLTNHEDSTAGNQTSPEYYTFRAGAKQIGVSPLQLTYWLAREGYIQYSARNKIEPTDAYKDDPIFYLQHVFTTKYGNKKYDTKLSADGIAIIRQRMRQLGDNADNLPKSGGRCYFRQHAIA